MDIPSNAAQAPQSPPPPPPAGSQAGPSPYAGPLDTGPPTQNPYLDTSGYAPPGTPRHVIPHRGSTVLTLGILGIITSLAGCGCCILFAPVGLAFSIPALVMGAADMKAIKEGRMDPSGATETHAGWICGIVGVGLMGIGLLLFIASMFLNLGINFAANV